MNIFKINRNISSFLIQIHPLDHILIDEFTNQTGLMEIDSEGDITFSNEAKYDLFLELDSNSDLQFKGV